MRARINAMTVRHIGIKPDAPWFIDGRYWVPVSTQWRKGEGNNP